MMMTRMKVTPLRRIRGATTVELVYMLPVFFILTFAVIEAAFVFRMRSTLNVASFHAARTGAMHNAMLAPIERKLAEGMMPLYMKGSSDQAAYARAQASSLQQMTTLKAVRPPVVVISPTRSAFEAFSETRRMAIQSESTLRDRRAIPNDNLMYRDPRLKSVTIDGQQRPMNVQDANLLKISTYWCYRLKTPALDRIFNRIVSGISGTSGSVEQTACNQVAAANGGGYYLAVTSQSIVRMQSDVVYDGANLN